MSNIEVDTREKRDELYEKVSQHSSKYSIFDRVTGHIAGSYYEYTAALCECFNHELTEEE